MIINTLLLITFTIGALMDQLLMVSFGLRCAATIIGTLQLLFVQIPRVIKDMKNDHYLKILGIFKLPNYIGSLTNSGRVLLNIFLIIACASDKMLWIGAGYYDHNM